MCKNTQAADFALRHRMCEVAIRVDNGRQNTQSLKKIADLLENEWFEIEGGPNTMCNGNGTIVRKFAKRRSVILY